MSGQDHEDMLLVDRPLMIPQEELDNQSVA